MVRIFLVYVFTSALSMQNSLDTIKMLEAKHGILTQHVSKDTAFACMRGGGGKVEFSLLSPLALFWQ